MSESYRGHHANAVLAEELKAQGCAYPFGAADLLLKALTESGFKVVGA